MKTLSKKQKIVITHETLAIRDFKMVVTKVVEIHCKIKDVQDPVVLELLKDLNSARKENEKTNGVRSRVTALGRGRDNTHTTIRIVEE